MSDEIAQRATEALQGFIDPNTDAPLDDAVRNVTVDDGRASASVVLGYPAAGDREALAAALRGTLERVSGVSEAQVDVSWEIARHGAREGIGPLDGIRNIIAVASGKGGVGKSTVAANLALALQVEGARVGVLDADIYGPSQPRMLGAQGQPKTTETRKLVPLRSYELAIMSIGFLVDEETPMVWRGPMVTQALQQMLNDTDWGDLDYLVIDLPPGTGDIQLTLSQRVPVSGAVIVTTPQDIALLDARRGLKMFEKVSVPVLGIVENMSTHVCSQCGHEESIFGAGGGARMASDYDVTLLGELPLDIRIREQADGGMPTVVAEPESAIAQAYRGIARKAAARLAQQDSGAAMPNITIDPNG